MPEPLTIAAVTTLAVTWLANATAGGAVGNIADRKLQGLLNGVRDRLAGMRSAPDATTVARAIRIAQMQALERVVRDYEHSLRLPRLLQPSRTKRFIEAAIQFCAEAVGRAPTLDAAVDLRLAVPAVEAANATLADPAPGGVGDARATRLQTIAEDAVLAELRDHTGAAAFPRGFEEHFRHGRRGFRDFTTTFQAYLEQQLRTNDDFHRVYSTSLLARVELTLADTRDAVGRAESKLDAQRDDARRAIVDAAKHVREGDTLNFAITDSHFGRRLSADTTFNHARPLVGRADLVTIISNESRGLLGSPGAGVVAISAIGGSGKTRLLIEVARVLEKEMAVLWIREGMDVTLAAISQLPGGPVLLICDDAQRRSDLANILRLADARSDRTVVLVSTRPYGRDGLQAALYSANVAFDRLRDLGELTDVSVEDLIPLVREELGEEHRDLAGDLLRLAGGSVLVALAAARLLRLRELDPRTIQFDKEFRATVLEGFRQEALGALPGQLDADVARRVLETLAAIQPVPLDSDELATSIAAYVGTEISELRRIVAALIDGGVLRVDRAGHRIVPDVLGDFILDRGMVARGKPTALDAEILSALGSTVLVSLLRNVAELDWQRTVAGESVVVFRNIWQSFIAAFDAAPNWKRADWLEHLHPVAAFQPGAVAKFFKRFLQNPYGDTERSGLLNVRTRDDEVVRKIPALLAIVAQHPDHTDEALDMLWDIGRADERETNPYPDHAIRQLGDVVAYSRRRHTWMQKHALDALERWVEDSHWSAALHSPLLIAKAVLQTAMIEHAFNDRDSTMTMTRIGVHPQNTRALRLRAISLLERLVLTADVRGRHLALAELLDALNRPDGAFGHTASVEEEESFRDQYEAALDAIGRILDCGSDALALATIRADLYSSAKFTLLPWKAEHMRDLATKVGDTFETRLVRALSYGFRDWDSERQTYEEHARVQQALLDTVADELATEGAPPSGVAWKLANACDLYDAAKASYDSRRILHTLSQRHADLAYDIAVWCLDRALAGGGVHPEWLPALLSPMRTTKPDQYESLVRRAATADVDIVRRAAAAALYRPIGEPILSPVELQLTRAFLTDADMTVVRTALASMGFMHIEQVVPLLSFVQLRGEPAAAHALADAWTLRMGEESPAPDEVACKHIFAELLEVPDLGAAQWDVSPMLAALGRLHPEATIDFLSTRVERERQHWSSSAESTFAERYDAIPYAGFDGLQDALRNSGRYEVVMERLIGSLTTTVDRKRVKNEIAHTVLRALGGWDKVLEKIVRGWIDSAACDKLSAGCSLFEELPRPFAIENKEFVAALLDAGEACGPSVRVEIERAIEASAFSNDFVVRSVGEPHPITSLVASDAEAIAEEMAGVGATRAADFYARIAKRAHECLEEERRHDEETRRSR